MSFNAMRVTVPGGPGGAGEGAGIGPVGVGDGEGRGLGIGIGVGIGGGGTPQVTKRELSQSQGLTGRKRPK